MKREKIKSLIKQHYLMIQRLEDLLLDEPIQTKEFTCSADKIIDVVCDVFNTNCREQTRRKRVVYARHAASYLLNKHTDMTLSDIANSLGNIDHSSAHHSIKTCKNLMETDNEYLEKVKKVKDILAEMVTS
jgi:chromosomal replication initiation ATPase DnaA